MTPKSFQDHYPRETRYCYGCGPLNDRGHRIRSFWDGDETICRFDPEPFHTSMPGYVYGGLIASLIDCHGTGSAAAFAHRAEGREMGTDPPLRFVTGSLRVDYLKPTPLGVTLTLRGRKKNIKGRVVTVEVSVYADLRPPGFGQARRPAFALSFGGFAGASCGGESSAEAAGPLECARGEVVAVRMPGDWLESLKASSKP